MTSVRQSSLIARLVPLDSRQPQITTARKPKDFDVTKLKPATESSSKLLEGLREERWLLAVSESSNGAEMESNPGADPR